MSDTAMRASALALGGRALLALLAALFLSGASFADDVPQGGAVTVGIAQPVAAAPPDEVTWNLQGDFMYMESFGHEPHVLTIVRDIEGDGDPDYARTDAVNNHLDGDFAFRGDFGVMKNQWGLGITGFYFEQDGSLTRTFYSDDLGAAPGDASAVRYNGSAFWTQASWWGPDWRWGAHPDDEWGSWDGDPGDFMFFHAETALDVWTVDLYAVRTLAEKPESNVNLLFGAKMGSLGISTTSHHGIGGIEGEDNGTVYGVEGMSQRSSAEHNVLAGPYLALTGDARWGRLRLEGLLAQSVLFGEAKQRSKVSGFVGYTDESLNYNLEDAFGKSEDVAIPVSELRIKLLYDLTDNISVGAGAFAGIWWDAAVPPLTKPYSVFEGDDFEDTIYADALQEDTLVFLGFMGSVEFRFFSTAL